MGVATVSEDMVRGALADFGSSCDRPYRFFEITKMSYSASTPFTVDCFSIRSLEEPDADMVL